MSMTKADLVELVTDAIAQTSGPMISKKDCARVVDAFPPGTEDGMTFQLSPLDADADGHDSASHGGDDCDDANAAIKPGVAELCNGIEHRRMQPQFRK